MDDPKEIFNPERKKEVDSTLPEKVELVDDNAQIKQELHNLKVQLGEIRAHVLSAAQKQPEPTQTPQNNNFNTIRDFAEAMKSLKSYESAVVGDYRKLRKEVAEEMGDFEEEPDVADNPEQILFKALAQKFMAGSQPSPTGMPPQNVSPSFNSPPTPSAPAYSGGAGGLDSMEKINLKIEDVPLPVKNAIKDGKLDLATAKQVVLNKAQREGLEIEEKQIEELYNKIKGDNGRKNKTNKKPKKS